MFGSPGGRGWAETEPEQTSVSIRDCSGIYAFILFSLSNSSMMRCDVM